MNKIIFDNLLCDTAPKRAPQKTNRNRMMRKRNNIYIKSLLLIVAVVMGWSSAFAQEGSGNWKRSQTDRTTELFVPAVGYMGKQISRVVPTFLI